jgi:drug/metabolite transporter (DMT)-like permease
VCFETLFFFGHHDSDKGHIGNFWARRSADPKALHAFFLNQGNQRTKLTPHHARTSRFEEKMNRLAWFALIIGFIGVLIIAKPTGQANLTGTLAALGAGLTAGLVMVNLRHLGKTENALTTTLYFAIFASILTFIPALFVWKMPDAAGLILAIIAGIIGGLAQLYLTKAYKYASAASVGPFHYTQIIWATFFGFIVWGHVPELHVIIGATIIIASSLMLLITKKPATENP